MHRQFSLQPFSRHYSHSTHPFLDFLEIEESSPKSSTSGPSSRINVRPSEEPHLLEVLSTYKAVQRAGTLLTLNFVTVNDYLWLLRAVSQEMSLLGRHCLYYLAAAVSDFFLPRQKMVGSVFFTAVIRACDDLPRTVRTQNTVRQGQSPHRDGSGTEDPEAASSRVDSGRFHRLLQGARTSSFRVNLTHQFGSSKRIQTCSFPRLVKRLHATGIRSSSGTTSTGANSRSCLSRPRPLRSRSPQVMRSRGCGST